MQLILTGCWANITIIGNTFCAFTIDRMGRVFSLKCGWIGDVCAMIGLVISIAKFNQTGSHAAAVSGVAFLYLHMSVLQRDWNFLSHKSLS
jgi:hypothetical protein